VRRWLPLLLLAALPGLAIETAPELATAIRETRLDPDQCYRVREIHFSRQDLRFYLTEGYIIFGKPVAGRIISAVFSAEVEGGDAELLLMPPTRTERFSLAAFTKSPNLNEHFSAALMLFTDDTAEVLMRALKDRGPLSPSPERGLLLSQAYNNVLNNISSSFAVRLIEQILEEKPPAAGGTFYAAIQGRRLGNFDAYYDPESQDQIYLGQIAYRDSRAYYDTWTTFQARSFRDGSRPQPKEGFTLANYRIQAVLDDQLTLKVVTQATLTPQRNGLRVLSLDISSGMKVTAARINGEEASLFTRDSFRSNLLRRNDSSVFLIIPSQPLESGRHYELVIEHEGNVVRPAGRNVYYVGSRANWYPRSGLHFARFDVTFSYPAHLQLIFPGDIKQDSTEGAVRTTRRVTPSPVRLLGFNLGIYEQAKVTRDKLTVELLANREVETALLPRRRDFVMIPPPTLPWPQRGPQWRRPPEVIHVPMPIPDPVSRLEPLASEIASAFEFLAAHLGPPALNTLMVSPIPGAFGQGFPGLVYLSTLSYLNPNDRPASAHNSQQQLFFSEILHAHETAHQWWGNVVTSGSAQDEWLMEALANYSALLLLEKKKGARAVSSVLNEYKQKLLEKNEAEETVDSAGPVRLGARLQNSLSPGAWHAIVYGKGSWILHMLRARIGEDNFLKLLGEVCKRYRYQPITVRQFQDLAASYMPKDSADPRLDGFFDHWVENTGIPALNLQTAIRGKAPAYKLTLTLTQSGVEEKTSLMVPVEVQIARGKTQTYWMSTGPEPATLTIPLRVRPLKITLDPANTILRN
jgi:hypothetical protein